ncbi:MAG TPA: GNAT family N-acetyltransferase [Candidatus Saccharimonadales bacterium]|nr:GNAT family N-acetyltransferase [Candidatus Saccharimonadales bacterium]
MDYRNLKKKFVLPQDYQAPQELTFDDLVARPLKRTDLKDDIDGVNSSLELIRKTRGGLWPSEPVTEEFDLLDLAWHEREFRDATSFAYVVYATDGRYIGCFYLYPMGERTELTEDRLQYDVDASWWVTAEAYGQGYYKKLYKALQEWMTNDFPFEKVYYSNKGIPA